ncbi:MAG TPA: META domain-containing protein [Sphingomicrobium sp.]
MPFLALLCAGCTSIAADARTFEGTRWHAVAINGRTTPTTGNYVVRFQRGQIGGQFGCNHFGGDYRIRGDTLTAGAIRTTMMACSEPAASFEGEGFAILNQPMRMTWSSSQRLTLSNAAGSLDLSLVR